MDHPGQFLYLGWSEKLGAHLNGSNSRPPAVVVEQGQPNVEWNPTAFKEVGLPRPNCDAMDPEDPLAAALVKLRPQTIITSPESD
jgi:hypothetical protein